MIETSPINEIPHGAIEIKFDENNYIIPNPCIIKQFIKGSSGPGGQNVNKLATRVTLTINTNNQSFPQDLLALLQLNSEFEKQYPKGLITLTADKERQQSKNLNIAIKRARSKITNLLNLPKERKRTAKPERKKDGTMTQEAKKKFKEKKNRERRGQSRGKINY